MFLLISIIPATLWVVLGYFILVTSSKTQGPLQTFGRLLSAVVFVFGLLSLIAGGYATFSGMSPGGAMQSMHSGAGQ